MLRSRPILAVIAVLLGGCTPYLQWQPVEAPKAVRVDFLHLNHEVVFAPEAVALAAEERDRLEAFLDDAEVVPGDRVYLRAAAKDGLAAQRQTSLTELMRQRGLQIAMAPVSSAVGGDRLTLGNVVVVEVERAVATPPDCPNWSKPVGYDPMNTPSSNFGCATATNLGLMVAEPGDLVMGRVPGAADAEPAIRAIQRYREGHPTVLDNSGSQATAPVIGVGQ